MNASCYFSIELDSGIPLAVIVSKLRDAVEWIEKFEEGKEIHEIKGFREAGVKIGQVDLDVEK